MQDAHSTLLTVLFIYLFCFFLTYVLVAQYRLLAPLYKDRVSQGGLPGVFFYSMLFDLSICVDSVGLTVFACY